MCYILQASPVAHDEPVFRHDAVVKNVVVHCTRQGWRVEEKPRGRHEDGTLYKQDLIIFKRPTQAVVVDVQVSWETGPSMLHIWNKKKTVNFWRPDTKFSFHPVILGARGIWPACNSSTEAELNIKATLKRSCVASTLKRGCSAHRTFMKRVWKLPSTQRFRQAANDIPATTN